MRLLGAAANEPHTINTPNPVALAGSSEVVEFSPNSELTATMEVVEKKRRGNGSLVRARLG